MFKTTVWIRFEMKDDWAKLLLSRQRINEKKKKNDSANTAAAHYSKLLFWKYDTYEDFHRRRMPKFMSRLLAKCVVSVRSLSVENCNTINPMRISRESLVARLLCWSWMDLFSHFFFQPFIVHFVRPPQRARKKTKIFEGKKTPFFIIIFFLKRLRAR